MMLSRSTTSTAAASRRAPAMAAASQMRRHVVVCAAAAAEWPTKMEMLQTVHRFFDTLHDPSPVVEDLVTEDVKLVDDDVQACYQGFRGIRHRLQALHGALPRLREVAEVADEGAHAVAAHWLAPADDGNVCGSFVLHFAEDGRISSIFSARDSTDYFDA